MDITIEELVEINKRLGGHLVKDSSLSFAESACRGVKSDYRKAALYTRAIIVDHPFVDANKRTALYTIDKFIGVKDQERMTKAIVKIAKESIHDIGKIEEVLKNANR